MEYTAIKKLSLWWNLFFNRISVFIHLYILYRAVQAIKQLNQLKKINVPIKTYPSSQSRFIYTSICMNHLLSFFFMNRERSRANLQYKIYTCVTEWNARWQQPQQQQQRTASEIIPGSDFVAIVRLRVRGLELIIRACMSLENSTNLQEDLSILM